ncbi:unnamed protein product [Ectocarpus sp. 8 AP-2014]
MIHELTHRRHSSLIARAHRCTSPREGVVRKAYEGKKHSTTRRRGQRPPPPLPCLSVHRLPRRLP